MIFTTDYLLFILNNHYYSAPIDSNNFNSSLSIPLVSRPRGSTTADPTSSVNKKKNDSMFKNPSQVLNTLQTFSKITFKIMSGENKALGKPQINPKSMLIGKPSKPQKPFQNNCGKNETSCIQVNTKLTPYPVRNYLTIAGIITLKGHHSQMV